MIRDTIQTLTFVICYTPIYNVEVVKLHSESLPALKMLGLLNKTTSILLMSVKPSVVLKCTVYTNVLCIVAANISLGPWHPTFSCVNAVHLYAWKYTHFNSHSSEFCLRFKCSILILPSLITRGVCILNHLLIDSPHGLIIWTHTSHTHTHTLPQQMEIQNLKYSQTLALSFDGH